MEDIDLQSGLLGIRNWVFWGVFSRLRNVIKQFNRLDLCIYEKFMLNWQSLPFDVGLKLGLWGFCFFDFITNFTLILKVLTSHVFSRQTTPTSTVVVSSHWRQIFTRAQLCSFNESDLPPHALQHTFDALWPSIPLWRAEAPTSCELWVTWCPTLRPHSLMMHLQSFPRAPPPPKKITGFAAFSSMWRWLHAALLVHFFTS